MNLQKVAIALAVVVLTACSDQVEVKDQTRAVGSVTPHQSITTQESIQVHETRKFTKKEINCLANNIYYEARGESDQGKFAVAMVTLNRATSDTFPNNVCSVVYQKKRGVCQFSWVCEGHDLSMRDKSQFRRCLEIAKHTVANYGTFAGKIVDGAMFYHADYVEPWWAKKMTPVKKIGRHIFYTNERYRA